MYWKTGCCWRTPRLPSGLRATTPQNIGLRTPLGNISPAWSGTPISIWRPTTRTNFLRSWLNQYAVLILPNEGYTFREHTTGGPPDKIFEEAAFLNVSARCWSWRKATGCGLGGRFRGRGWNTARRSLQTRPTHFGTVGYQIVSSVDDGKIKATVWMPSRGGQKAVLLRFRHPKAAPIKSVTVNGQAWKQFDKDKEVIRLEGLTGTVAVEAVY